MFTRANPRLRRRGLAILLDNVALVPANDPLLFLYPQWFTAALQQRRSIASIKAATDTKRVCGHGLPAARRFPARLGKSSKQWISSSTTLENTAEGTESETPTVAKDDCPHNASDDCGIPESRRSQNPHSALPVSDLAAEEKRAALDLFADIVTPDIEPTQRTVEANQTGTTHARPLARPRPGEKVLSAVRRLSMRDQRKLRRRLFFLKTSGARDRKSRRAQLTDVKDMLERLDRDSREWSGKGPKRKELLLPEETVVLLAGFSETAMKENVWYVPVHNGCRVHVLDPRESDGPYRKVVLSGSPTVVKLVAHRIASVQQRQASGDPLVDVRTPPVPIYPSAERARRKNLPVPLVRGVWDSYMVFHPKPLDAVLASRDSLTTVKEFNEFVEDLTMSRPSRHLRQETGRHHQEQVAEALVELFRDETKSKLFSSAALNQALTFLYKHEFRSSARVVLLKADHVATVVTFNILLSGAARWLDVASFRSFLITMRRLRIRPNEWTWLAFLDCHVTNKGKINLVSYLLQRDYLTTDSLQDALHLTIQNLFSEHLKSGQDVDSFLNMVIHIKAVNWFSVSMLNQLFSVIAKRRDHSALERLLTICEEQNLAVDPSIINHVVEICRRSILNAIPYALRIMERGFRAALLEGDTFEKLFKMAYKGQRYNICRVLWRYACIHRQVTRKMKEIVVDSLACNKAPAWGTGISKRFEVNAGKTIVGVGTTRGFKHPVFDDLPHEFQSNPLLYLISSVKRGRETDPYLRRRVAKALVYRDMKVGPHYRPLLPLPLMLHAAMVVDSEWDLSPRPVSWFLQNALRVPVEFSERRMSKSAELE